MPESVVTNNDWLSTMDGSLKLVVLSVVMLLGSYLSGSIPLFMSLSEEKLQASYCNANLNFFRKLPLRSLSGLSSFLP